MPDPTLETPQNPQADQTSPVLSPPGNSEADQDSNAQQITLPEEQPNQPEEQSQQTTPEQSVTLPETTPPQSPPPITQEILKAFDEANKSQTPNFQTSQPREPDQDQYTNEQLLELRDSNPVQYDQILIDKASKAAEAASFSQYEKFQDDLKQQNIGKEVDVLIDSSFPDYKNDQSNFRRDVDYVAKGIETQPHLQRLAACALVFLRTSQEKGIKAAEQRGAKQEQKRNFNAAQSIGANSNPQNPQEQLSIDPWYQQYGQKFGVDPQKLQERHNSANEKPKNTFM